MSTHPAVVTVAIREPLQIIQLPTVAPESGEVRVRVEWTASTPLDLHQADGGLLVKHPQVLGDVVAGTIVEVGPDVKDLRTSDKVFGFTWRSQKEKAHQEYVTLPIFLVGKIPSNVSPQEAVTLPTNVVTVFHTLTADLSLSLPWPLPESPEPQHASAPILIWGGASSVGQFAIQVLRAYGYRNILATASPKHHSYLHSLGATHLIDYRASNAVEQILSAAGDGVSIPSILDCIGLAEQSMLPLSRLTSRFPSSTTVAVLLPVILSAPTSSSPPSYSLDASSAVPWGPNVTVRGVRTHFYLDNQFFKEKLQSEIVPKLLENGIVKPNRYRTVEGATLLERAERALAELRSGNVSGEKLVWKVAE